MNRKANFFMSVAVFFIFLMVITAVSCENASSSDSTTESDGTTDNSSSLLLQSMPAMDMAEYDLSVGDGSTGYSLSSRAIGDIGDWSVGAGFAKALRNRAISLRRKAEYFADLIQALDLVFEEVQLPAGSHYFDLGEMEIPFVGVSVPAVMRAVVDTNDRIAVDVAVEDEVVLQIYTDGGNDGDDETQTAQVWIYLDATESQDYWEKTWIQVDTMTADSTEILFEQSGESTGEATVTYNYTGSLVQDTSGTEPFNVAEAALHEDFSGGEDFAYTVSYRSMFNENYGSTVAFQDHIRTAGSDSYGPEAWSVTTNKRVDETDTTIAHYYDEINAVTVDDLPEIDTTNGLPVAKIASDDRPISGVTPWDGVVPEGTELVEVDIGQIPVEVAPEYVAWDKYDDLTTFTNLEEEPASVVEEIYADID